MVLFDIVNGPLMTYQPHKSQPFSCAYSVGVSFEKKKLSDKILSGQLCNDRFLTRRGRSDGFCKTSLHIIKNISIKILIKKSTFYCVTMKPFCIVSL